MSKTNHKNHKHHFVSNLNYHIIICPKYRHKVMINEVKDFLKIKFNEIINKYNYELLDISIEEDHVHFALKLEPTYSIGSVVRNLKSISGYYMFKDFPGLRKKYFWNSGFWTNGYFVSTVGDVSKETILNYIKNQENYI